MIQRTKYPFPPDAVSVAPLPGGGTDIRLRRDIATETCEAPEGGEAYPVPTPTEQWQNDTDAALVELAGMLDYLMGGAT